MPFCSKNQLLPLLSIDVLFVIECAKAKHLLLCVKCLKCIILLLLLIILLS